MSMILLDGTWVPSSHTFSRRASPTSPPPSAHRAALWNFQSTLRSSVTPFPDLWKGSIGIRGLWLAGTPNLSQCVGSGLCWCGFLTQRDVEGAPSLINWRPGWGCLREFTTSTLSEPRSFTLTASACATTSDSLAPMHYRNQAKEKATTKKSGKESIPMHNHQPGGNLLCLLFGILFCAWCKYTLPSVLWDSNFCLHGMDLEDIGWTLRALCWVK